MVIYDLLIIGGGINGAGIACDAAGRGLKTYLCDKGDFAGATSSASSKLIHGGLRYLEQGDLRLVRESLLEREILLKKAPHLIKPVSFVLPYEKNLRPWWQLKVGLWLYDHLATHRSLPFSRSQLNGEELQPLNPTYTKGASYYDCQVDDARLVIANLQSAREQGALVENYRECVSITRVQDYWQIKVKNQFTKEEKVLLGKCLINAAGPWVENIKSLFSDAMATSNIRKVKGSHILVKKWYMGNQAYILQHPDKRIVFVIPFLKDFVLIGTTEENYMGDPSSAKIDLKEIEYLLVLVNHYFKQQFTVQDIIWQYSGVRPLHNDRQDDARKVSRDYKIELEYAQGLPVIHLYGGKITTYRRVAEQILRKVDEVLNITTTAWTANAPLPGGNISKFSLLVDEAIGRYPWLDTCLLTRYCHLYGTQVFKFLANITSYSDLGRSLGASLYGHEIQYLVANEWVKTVDDLIWRRTKLGILLNPMEIFQIDAYLKEIVKN